MGLLLCFALCANGAFAQSKEKIYAVFLINFGQKIQWPTDQTNEDFVIGVFDDLGVASELKTMAKVKSIKNQKIAVKEFGETTKLEFCHILFIPASHSSSLSAVISRFPTSPILIVTEKQGLARKGSGINFLVADDKLNFELNAASLEKRNMKPSNDLKRLGILVD